MSGRLLDLQIDTEGANIAHYAPGIGTVHRARATVTATSFGEFCRRLLGASTGVRLLAGRSPRAHRTRISTEFVAAPRTGSGCCCSRNIR